MASALAVMVVGTMGFTTTTAFASPQVDPDLDISAWNTGVYSGTWIRLQSIQRT